MKTILIIGLIAYIILGIVYALILLQKHKKWKKKWDPDDTYSTGFNLMVFITIVLFWPIILMINTEL